MDMGMDKNIFWILAVVVMSVFIYGGCHHSSHQSSKKSDGSLLELITEDLPEGPEIELGTWEKFAPKEVPIERK